MCWLFTPGMNISCNSIQLRVKRRWLVLVLVGGWCWCIGVLVYWCIGVLVYWCIGGRWLVIHTN